MVVVAVESPAQGTGTIINDCIGALSFPMTVRAAANEYVWSRAFGRVT